MNFVYFCENHETPIMLAGLIIRWNMLQVSSFVAFAGMKPMQLP